MMRVAVLCKCGLCMVYRNTYEKKREKKKERGGGCGDEVLQSKQLHVETEYKVISHSAIEVP